MIDDVDVMLPAYGDDRLLREAIMSVVGQDSSRWRLTVVDDAAATSSGDLERWIRSLGDSRIVYVPNPTRLGINRNFQRCADLASSDLVVLLGADDRLLSHFVGTVREVAERHPDVAWIHAGAQVIDGNGAAVLPLVDRVKRRTALRVRDEIRLTEGEELATSLLHGNWMYFPSVIFRREWIQKFGFSPGLDIVLDLDLYLRMIVNGSRVALLGKPGIEYRRHASSVSSAGAGDGSRFAEEADYFRDAELLMRGAGWSKAARAARIHWTSRLHGMVRILALLRTRQFDLARHVGSYVLRRGGHGSYPEGRATK